MTNKNIIECTDANELKACEKFLKQYRKESEPDLLVNKNGRVLKVNNLSTCYNVFYYNTDTGAIDNDFMEGSYLIEYINKTDFYNSEKACEKAIKRKEIENKLRLLAFELNGNKDIDWKDNKTKYFICYSTGYFNNFFQSEIQHVKEQGVIYCYSKNFTDKTVELIGEKDLKDYLINC